MFADVKCSLGNSGYVSVLMGKSLQLDAEKVVSEFLLLSITLLNLWSVYLFER